MCRKYMRVSTLAWLAGILEGEGTFGTSRNSPSIKLEMCDKDIVQKVAHIFNTKFFLIKRNKIIHPTWSDSYRVAIYGDSAYKWMKLLLPWMGKRRSKKIKQILNKCKYVSRRQDKKGIKFFV